MAEKELLHVVSKEALQHHLLARPVSVTASNRDPNHNQECLDSGTPTLLFVILVCWFSVRIPEFCA